MGATKHDQPVIGQAFDEQRRERVERADDVPCGMILCNLDQGLPAFLEAGRLRRRNDEHQVARTFAIDQLAELPQHAF